MWQGTHTYTTREGKYVKVGSLVTVFGKIIISSRGSSTSEFGITGLPFSGGGGPHSGVLGIHSGYGSAPLIPTSVVPTGASVEGTHAYFRTMHSTNASYNINQLNSSGEFTFSITYSTTS